MRTIIEHVIFADHYQFYIFDGDSSPYENIEEWSEDAVKRGYVSSCHSIGISTLAHFNCHKVSVFLTDEPIAREGSEVYHQLSMSIASGCVRLTSPAYSSHEEPRADIPVGEYLVTIRGYDLGEEEEDDLPDEVLLSRDDLERYEIFFAQQVAADQSLTGV